MKDIIALHRDIVSRKIDIDSLINLQESLFKPECSMIINEKINNSSEIAAFIKLCNDYYVYSENGDVLITDSEYDQIMNQYMALGNSRIIYPDAIPSYTTWPFIEHTAPGMVGSINKIYTEEELQKYLDGLNRIDYLILAPKFDGISVCIEKRNDRIEYAVTRADGSKGQNILPVVREAWNSNIFSGKNQYWNFTKTGSHDKNDVYLPMEDGYYKCELLIAQDQFNELIKEKRYANRRSATSGIVNSPKNLQYAHYITIMPLAYYNGKNRVDYIVPGQKEVEYTRKASVLLKDIEKMLKIIRRSDFPYRTDGVVIFPKSSNLLINHNDIMDEAIAYKVNTAEALTTIAYGYMSVGRLGNAIPMLHVYPVEVNETIVTDVSLGSYDKFASMDLHEGETVKVYSAGDVIPQIKLPEQRDYNVNAPYLKIDKRCSYCNDKLERIGNEYKCTNPECLRIVTGKITNFLVKLDVDNISDKTIEDLYNAKLIRSVKDLFNLDVDAIARLQGYSVVSANNITEAINKLASKEVTVSSLFGAIGIPNISEKKCRNIFQYISINNILDDSKKKIIDKILDADNIGMKTAEDFVEFVVDNRNVIRFLLDHMNIKPDKKYSGNVVFTGFRDSELEKQFNEIGYEISDNVNSKTVAVVSASNNESSTKCKAARKKGISIVNLADINYLLSELQKRH